jgi:hypothetical protein
MAIKPVGADPDLFSSLLIKKVRFTPKNRRLSTALAPLRQIKASSEPTELGCVTHKLGAVTRRRQVR